ncbi:hypothetical protein [Microbacterium sp. P04]|uniref:hypothetical protein n=1 Tax=Microbacterium sp. P04 TaxID=3366947 RepID=UPI003744B65A
MTDQSSGTSYWVTQIAVCAVAGVAFPVLGVLMFTWSPEEPGRGVLMIFIGLAFLGTLIYLISSYRRMSKAQQALYAWAINQVNGSAAGAAMSPARMMTIASRAQAGDLTPEELHALQALRPDVPYPGTIPPLDGAPYPSG